MGELFTKLERAAWGGFVVAQGRLFQRIEDDLRRKFGITHTELEVLLWLAFEGNGRARIQDLSARSLLSRSGTSRAVDRLVRAGYVDRVGAEEDGRGAYAVLTTRGRTHFLAAAKAHVALARRDFLSHFSADEQETLAGFWRRIADRHHPHGAHRSRRSRATAASRSTAPPPRESDLPLTCAPDLHPSFTSRVGRGLETRAATKPPTRPTFGKLVIPWRASVILRSGWRRVGPTRTSRRP